MSALGDKTWDPVLEEDFSDVQTLEQWKLDGAADVSITEQGELLIQTQKKEMGGILSTRSALWYREPFWGDLRFEFDARGDPRSSRIFFFNAQPLKGHQSIFEWERPLSAYVDYTGDERLQMYTLGMLRYTEEKVNLRFVGGPLAGFVKNGGSLPNTNNTDPDKQGRFADDFGEQTIFFSYRSPFKELERNYHFDLQAIGHRLTLRVDGREIFDFEDKAREENPLRGGYFAFRNFATTRNWFTNLRVYRLNTRR